MASPFPYYELKGIRYPRLTRILSILRDPDVEDWLKAVGTEAALRRQRAALKRGTLIHQMIAKTLKTGKEATLPKQAPFELRMCWQAWKRWYGLRRVELVKSRYHLVESAFTSSVYGYGCTPDLVEVEPNMVTDWKTGSRLQSKHWIQVHAEVPLVFGDNPKGIRVRLVRLDPAIGDMEEAVQPFDPSVFDTFLKLKDVYVAWYGTELKGKPNGEESKVGTSA